MQGVSSVTPGAQSVGVNIGRETVPFGEPWSGGQKWPFAGGVAFSNLAKKPQYRPLSYNELFLKTEVDHGNGVDV